MLVCNRSWHSLEGRQLVFILRELVLTICLPLCRFKFEISANDDHSHSGDGFGTKSFHIGKSVHVFGDVLTLTDYSYSTSVPRPHSYSHPSTHVQIFKNGAILDNKPKKQDGEVISQGFHQQVAVVFEERFW